MTERAPHPLSIAPGLFSKPKRARVQRVSRDRRTVDGIVFDSKSEMDRWLELRMLERAGEIRGLERQVEYVLAFNGRAVKMRSAGFPNGRDCKYHADFRYATKDGTVVVEEHKDHDDEAARLRRAVVEALFDIEITVTGKAAKNTPAKGEGSRMLGRKG